MNKAELAEQALTNAVTNASTMNYDAIINGFVAKGIDIEDIKPRENVFTFNAWKALGRVVCKGEKGVAVVTYVKCKKKNTETGEEGGEEQSFRRPKTTYVFHISQTQELTH